MGQIHSVQAQYELWVQYPNHPESIQNELSAIRGDEKAIEDRFFQDLEFGTGGLRGILGAGTNRMNIYTVRKATLGLARYIRSRGENAAAQGVVVGYDCRRMSREFAEEVGLVMVAAGVKAYVFEHLCPTPELSFAVRHLGAAAGVMITASHNPPEYNGYKVYGSDGGQLLPDVAERVMGEIADIQDLFQIPISGKREAEETGAFQWVGEEIDRLYNHMVVQHIAVDTVEDRDRTALNIVYTPLHGTGNLPVQSTLQDAGYTDVHIVESQAEPDGEFPTVKSPNPEERAAFVEALQLAQQVGADIVMGTDPDADRVGVAVHDGHGEYRLLTGNQTGGLLVDFYLSQLVAGGRLPANAIVFKTIVTSDLGAAVASTYGVSSEDTLTGFKYIGERIAHYEATGERTFVFGYEESYGYLVSPFVRDKDAVQSCLLIAEMSAFHKRHGRTLVDGLNDLYDRVGHYDERLISVTLPGVDGLEKIRAIMEDLRQRMPTVPGLHLDTVEDYQARARKNVSSGAAEPLVLPQADVLKYVFREGPWMAVRPSGTEPKIKLYLGGRGDTNDACQQSLQHMQEWADDYLSRWRG